MLRPSCAQRSGDASLILSVACVASRRRQVLQLAQGLWQRGQPVVSQGELPSRSSWVPNMLDGLQTNGERSFNLVKTWSTSIAGRSTKDHQGTYHNSFFHPVKLEGPGKSRVLGSSCPGRSDRVSLHPVGETDHCGSLARPWWLIPRNMKV